jgi:hypothetical protein
MGSLMVLTQQLDELEQLRREAQASMRQQHVEQAIDRVYAALERRIRPLSDDVQLVQQFMGSRTAQDRYGK